VFGFVSMRQATSRRPSREVVEVDAAVVVRADLDDLEPAIVTVAGFVPCAVSA
jgi:hypothetical protein